MDDKNRRTNSNRGRNVKTNGKRSVNQNRRPRPVEQRRPATQTSGREVRPRTSNTRVTRSQDTSRRTNETTRRQDEYPIRTRPKKDNEARAYRSSASYILVVGFLAIVFGFYGIFFIINYFNHETLDTMVVQSIDITKNDWQKAIVIRDENVYKATSDMVDKYIHVYNSNEDRVKKGEALATVLDENLSGDTKSLDSSYDMNFNIQDYNDEYEMNKNEIDEIDLNIKRTIDSFDTDDFSNINDYKNDISSQLNTRNRIIINNSRDQINSELIDSFGEDLSTEDNIYAENSGIFTRDVDGLENTINFDTMEDLTEDQTKMESEYIENSLNKVTENEDLFRVVESTLWYIGAYLDSEVAKDLEVGDEIYLYIDNNTAETLRTKVYYVSPDIGDKKYVIFENSNRLMDFINRRSILIALDKDMYSTFKIPESAIATKEMIKVPIDYIYDDSVIKVTMDVPQSVTPITVWGYTDDNKYALIERDKNSLKYGDTITTTGENPSQYLISDSEDVTGVYVTNDGAARFKQVTINDNIEKEDNYVYISSNGRVKNHDRIIVDASLVTDDMLIE